MNSLYHVNTKSGKQSTLVLTGDSDNYFNDMTTVKTMKDNQAGAPVFQVVKVRPVGGKKRYLLVRYKVVRPVKDGGQGPATAPVETGAVTVTLENPSATTLIGVNYTDDEETTP